MATGTLKSSGNSITTQLLKISSVYDFPLAIYETGNEDTKGIRLFDANNQMRYELKFTGGHLRFSSWDASGNYIVNNAQII